MLMEGKIKEIAIPDDFLEKIKGEIEEKYRNTSPVDCPYLKDKVYFNSRGLDHMKFKAWNRPRVKFDQYLRLKLFPLVPEALRRSNTVQGIWKRREWERQKRHGRWEKSLKDVAYYEFVAVIGKVRIKVVVKEIADGRKFFWSIIPFWKMNEASKERKLYDEELEKDGNIVSDLENEKSPVA
jgi:hypothetical protein